MHNSFNKRKMNTNLIEWSSIERNEREFFFVLQNHSEITVSERSGFQKFHFTDVSSIVSDLKKECTHLGI